MRWLVALALAALALRHLGSERIADAVRWADQRLELFSPRGAGLYALLAPRLLRPLHRVVAGDVSALAPAMVVDVGTGPGALAVEIARLNPAASVVGIDLAPEMLATAQERAREAGVGERVEFITADAAALPLADGSVDVVVSTLSLHHWRDVPGVLRELHRVVREGGRVLLYDARFSYSPRQFIAFLAGTGFTVTDVEHDRIHAGPVPIALFERYGLRR